MFPEPKGLQREREGAAAGVLTPRRSLQGASCRCPLPAPLRSRRCRARWPQPPPSRAAPLPAGSLRGAEISGSQST